MRRRKSYAGRYLQIRHRSTQLSLPVPKLVVFYNGERETEDETILRLTDSFPEDMRQESDIEVRVRMLNINYGRNTEAERQRADAAEAENAKLREEIARLKAVRS